MGFGVWGLGFGVWELGFRVSGLGFRVSGLGFRVQGLGFTAPAGARMAKPALSRLSRRRVGHAIISFRADPTVQIKSI